MRRCAIETIDSPVGPLIAGSVDEGICLLEFSDPKRLEPQLDTLRRQLTCEVEHGGSTHLDRLQRELDAYFAGRSRRFDVPLVIAGTAFQERVWRALLEIPFGTTVSYEALARTVGADGAQRAVGHANGSNRIAIVIPCHRVINKNGKLGGYGGELWRKQALLRLESGGRLLDFDAR